MPGPISNAQSLPCPQCGSVVRMLGRQSGERLTCPGCFAALTLNVTAQGPRLFGPSSTNAGASPSTTTGATGGTAHQPQPIPAPPKPASSKPGAPPPPAIPIQQISTKPVPVKLPVEVRRPKAPVAPRGKSTREGKRQRLSPLWGLVAGFFVVVVFASWSTFSTPRTEPSVEREDTAKTDSSIPNEPADPAVPKSGVAHSGSEKPAGKAASKNVASAPTEKPSTSTAAGIGPEKGEPQPPPPTATRALTTQELVKLRDPAVFRLLSPYGVGTGFVVQPGLAVTNEHCIGQADLEDVYLEFPSRPGSQYQDVQMAYAVPDSDLVILRVRDLPDAFQTIPILETAKLEKGERLVIIGNPGGLENVVTEGIFGSVQKLGPATFLQLSAAINAGNSGGPAFTDRGLIAGVVALKSANNEGIGFAIPGDVLRSGLRTIENRPPGELSQLAEKWRARQTGSQLWIACRTCQEIIGRLVAADRMSKSTGEKRDDLIARIEVETAAQRQALAESYKRIPETIKHLTPGVIDAADLALLNEMYKRFQAARAIAMRPRDSWDTLETDSAQLNRELVDWKERLKKRLGVMSFCEGIVQTFGGSDAE